MRDTHDAMGAAGLQVRRKTLAVLIGAWLIVCGFLVRHHEATVGHAVERATGQLVHADQLVGHHEDDAPSDVHDRGPDHGDHDECVAAALLRTATMTSSAEPAIAEIHVRRLELAHAAVTVERAAPRVYRLAPKTSPPVG